MKKWFLSLVLILMVTISGLGVNYKPVYASEPTEQQLNIVALGDSISTGYGLTDKANELFLNKIASSKNANLTNLAVDGYKAEDVYNVATLADNLTTIQNANAILVTVGGNDILQPLLSAIQNQVGKDLNNATPDEITTAVMMLFLTQQQTIIDAINAGISSFNQHFPNLAEALRQKNAKAQIIFQTVYNPAEKCTDTMYVTLYEFIDPFIQQVNATINNATYKNAYSYQVFDTYTEFKNYEQQAEELLTNIAEFDVHPNALGNEVIYSGMVEKITELPKGSTNSTTIKIFTNGVYVNNPEQTTDPVEPSEPVEPVTAGGEVKGLTKDENGYDIFEVELNTTKELEITEFEGYKLTDVKLGETSIGAENVIELNASNLPNTISIYFLQQFEVTFSTGYNGYIMVNSNKLDNPETSMVEQVLYGGSINCSFIANYGYEVFSMVIDGEPIVEVSGSSYVFENINKNHTFVVNFAKIERTTYTDPTYKIKLDASTESLPYGSTLNIQALTSGHVYNEILELLDPYSKNMIIYDFSIKKGNLTISPNGEFLISIPVSTSFNMEKTKLYYVSNEYEAEELEYTYDEEKRVLTFTTNHCSYYALIQEGEPPKNLWWIWIIVGVVVISAVAVTIVLVNKKKNDEKIRKEIEEKNKNEYFSY